MVGGLDTPTLNCLLMQKMMRVINILPRADLIEFNLQKKEWPFFKKVRMAVLCECAHIYWIFDDVLEKCFPRIEYPLVVEQKKYLVNKYGKDPKNYPPLERHVFSS